MMRLVQTSIAAVLLAGCGSAPGSGGDAGAKGAILSLGASGFQALCPCLYVTNRGSSAFSVTVYASRTGSALPINGNVAPIATIAGSKTELDNPTDVAVDSKGYIYVTNSNESITIYPPGSDGNAEPTRVIYGPNTNLRLPTALTLDARGDIYVANGYYLSGDESVSVFAAGANGNVKPIRSIAGTKTQLTSPSGVALDAKDRLYVSDSYNYSIVVFARNATGDAKPLRVVSGDKTMMNHPLDVVLDPAANMYVVNAAYPDGPATVFSAGASGNAKPMRTIFGYQTGINYPSALALDARNNLYIANTGNNSVTVYTPDESRDKPAISTIAGSNTGLQQPSGLTFH